MNKETILGPVQQETNRRGFRESKEDLERLGYFVPEVLETGEAVVQAVARLQPDLMLMDIRLRGSLDGIEAAYQAKAEFDLPVIYLTAYSDPDTLRRAALTGPDAFLLKPFDERELAANVQLALSRAKSGEPLRRELRGAMSLVDALEEPALIADLDGRIAHANRAAVAFLKVPDPSMLARVELSRILEPGWKESGRKLVKLQEGGVEAAGKIASVERLLRSDGREYGSLIVFGSMERRERLLLESSAAEANAALICSCPGHPPPSRLPVGGFLDLLGSGRCVRRFLGRGRRDRVLRPRRDGPRHPRLPHGRSAPRAPACARLGAGRKGSRSAEVCARSMSETTATIVTGAWARARSAAPSSRSPTGPWTRGRGTTGSRARVTRLRCISRPAEGCACTTRRAPRSA